MRTAALAILASLLAAGCLAGGESDPFAYTRKDLYSGGFDLARLTGEDRQEFRVTDGSIGAIRMLVWVNATEGGARVSITSPDGRTRLESTETTERLAPLDLGVWTVRVEPTPDSKGVLHIRVVRG